MNNAFHAVQRTEGKFYIYLAVYTKQEQKMIDPFDNLFICLHTDVSLTDAADSSDYVRCNDRKIRVMNWKGRERKRSWPILRYYPETYVEGKRETTGVTIAATGV